MTSPERGRNCYFQNRKVRKRKKHHPPSILHDKKSRTCYLCIMLHDNWSEHSTLQEHHVFSGPNRTNSEENEIKKKRTLAVLYENKRENYLCKHNNILYKGLGVEGYIDIQKVKLCRIQPDPQWWNGRQVWVGVDLSQTDDNTAVAMVTEDNGYIYARVMGFIPKEKINIKTQKEHVDYQRMISKGECIACGEEVIDYSVVENYVIHAGKFVLFDDGEKIKVLNHRMPTNSLRPQLGQQPKTWANTRI